MSDSDAIHIVVKPRYLAEQSNIIDDKYVIDIDDIYRVDDILSEAFKSKYQLKISKNKNGIEDEKYIGKTKF